MPILGIKDIFGKNINKEIKEIRDNLASLVTVQVELQDSAKNTNEQIEKNNATRKETADTTKKVKKGVDILTKSEEELGKITKRTTDLIAKANAERTQEGKKLAKATILRQEQNKKIKDTIKLEKAEAKSIARLKAENKKLRLERDDLATDTDVGINKIAELNAQIDENTEVIKTNTDAQSQQAMNIGNYASALDALPPGLQAAAGGVEDLKEQFVKLLANPAVAVFAAIAGTLTIMFSAFKSSRGGANSLAKSMTIVGAATEVVRNRTAAAISTAIENGNAMQNSSDDANTLDLSFKGLVQNIKNMIGSTDEATESLGDQITQVSDLKKELIDLNDAYVDIENELQKEIVTLQGLADIQGAIADDANRSLAEQAAAASKATELEQKAISTSIKLANERLEISQKEIDIAIKAGSIAVEADGNLRAISVAAIELKKSFTEAEIAVIELNNNMTISRIENEKRVEDIKRDAFEQDLDFLLDVADAQSTVNQARIADERLTLGARQVILEETDALLKKSFDDQIALFATTQEVQLDVLNLQKLNNKEIVDYAKGLGLSEIATNRLLEVTKERRFAIQDIADLEKDLHVQEQARLKEAEDTLMNIEEKRLLRAAENIDQREQLELLFAENQHLTKRAQLERELESIKGFDERAIEQRMVLNEELYALDSEFEEAKFDIEEEYRQKRLAEDAKVTSAIASNLQHVQSITKGIFDFKATLVENEIAGIERQRDAEIAAAEKSGKDTAAIENKYAIKERQLRRKQAVAEKKQAIFSAIINTAASIVKAAPIIPLMILMGVLGAVQIATISSTPIPSFEKGGKMKETGYARFSEEGRELMEYKGTTYITPEKETVGIVPKGAKFTSNWETEEILAAGGMTPEAYESKVSEVRVINKSTSINGDKITTTVESANSRILHEEEYFRF